MRHLVKKLTGWMLCIILAVGMPPMAGRKAKAEESVCYLNIYNNSIYIESKKDFISVNGGGLYSSVVIKGETVDNNITIKANANEKVTVVLSGVIIHPYKTLAPILIQGDGDVTLVLEGDNTVRSLSGFPGIQKESTGTLTITSNNMNNSLNAIGNTFGAGIGGGKNGKGSNIIIEGYANVFATGGIGGAGIGGGVDGEGSNIFIGGYANVTAIGGRCGAGIGGGENGEGSNITIGGFANIIAIGDNGGAGIGGGLYGDGFDITITGNATVKAAGGDNSDLNVTGAAIGQGVQYDDKNDYDGAESIITTITKESPRFDGQVWRYPAGTSAEKMAEDVENKMDGAERVEKATITFDSNNGETDEKVLIPGEDNFPEDLFRNEGYAIASWNTDPTGIGDSYLPGDMVPFIGETTLYAQWAKLYNVTVKNGKATDKNNKEITQAIKGATVTVKASELDEGKAFNEWSCDDKTVTFAVNNSFETTFVMPEGEVNVEAVIRNITITDLEESYTYTAAEIKPNVTVGFEGVDILLKEDEYVISYKDNVKPGTASVTVTINKPRTGSKTLTFKITGNTVRWLDDDGTLLEEAYYTTDMPSYSNGITPTKKEVPGHKYTFKGWVSGTFEKTEYGDVTTYSPEFYDEVVEYNVTFVDADGTVLQNSKVAYGELPAYSKTPTGATGAACPAKFTGWDPAITNVTGDATYTATYGEHVYNQEVVDANCLKSPADCITAAVYYKSCACGEKSTDEKDIFTSGDPAGHKWKAATGYAPKTCEVCGLEEGQKVTYDPIKNQVFVWTKGSKEPFVLAIKRSQDDVNCFLHYLNTLLDGAEIKVEARSGSTIITIPAETLEKLSVGEHMITVVFDDWKADFALSIAEPEATPTPTPAVDATPVTGDTMPVVPIAVVMVAAMAVAFAVRKKKQSAE